MRRGAKPNLRMNYHSPVDGRREIGVVALMYIRSAEAVTEFVAAGADVNIADEKGFTALIRASHAGKLDVVAALLEAGADASACTTEDADAHRVASVRMEEIRSLAFGANKHLAAERVEKFEQICDLLRKATESKD